MENRVYLIPQMYSKSTDTHQYLHPSSCHSPHITKNLPTSVVSRIRRNCSDRVENDEIFKNTIVQYKSYLLKSGYDEELIDKRFINCAVRVKRKDLLKKRKQKRTNDIEKYRMITDYEPTFPDIRKGFKMFKSIIEEDEELQEVFPKGINHFQISERRGAKNIKELLAPNIKFKENALEESESQNEDEIERDQDPEGCFPCSKPCAYCPLLQKLQGDTFHSKSNKKTFKIRQHINCKSQNVIYLVTCAKCNKQGVEHSMQFSKRMSNYFSHIKSGTRDCEISCHFMDDHQETWVPNYQENTDFLIQGIA